jgi:hypothetical protein
MPSPKKNDAKHRQIARLRRFDFHAQKKAPRIAMLLF